MRLDEFGVEDVYQNTTEGELEDGGRRWDPLLSVGFIFMTFIYAILLC